MGRDHRGMWAGAITALTGMLGGCWHTQHAAPDRGLMSSVGPHASAAISGSRRPAEAASAQEIHWPHRRTDRLQELLRATPDKLSRHRLAEGVDPKALTPDERESVEVPEYVILHKGVYGQSLLRIVAEPGDRSTNSILKFSDWLTERVTGFLPNAYVLSDTEFSDPRALKWLAESIESSKQSNAMLEATKSNVRVDVERANLRITNGLDARIPLEDCSAARGVILHLQALAGNEYEPKVLEELGKRSWVQIDLKTSTSISTPVPAEDEHEIQQLEERATQISKEMFSTDSAVGNSQKVAIDVSKHPRRREFEATIARRIELEAGRFDACPDSDLRALGTQLAGMVDEVLADNAYAAEALLEYIRTQRPDLAGKPVVIMGFSAGALAGPTIAARLGDRVKGMVLVGGAADLFAVSQSSKFSKNGRGSGGVRLRCNGKPVDAATVRAIDEAYLQATTLDPYAVGPRLQNLPILQVHATMDTWVPAKLGDLLYERLGRPERLSIWGGHEMLFYFMPSQAKRIADWVEKQALETR